MCDTEADDLLFGLVDQRRPNGDRVALDAPLLSCGGHASEGLDELGAAVRVAGVVDCIDPDPHSVKTSGLGHAEGDGQEDAVPGRDIGDRDAGRGPGCRDVDRGVGKSRPAPGRRVEPDDQVLGPVVPGDPCGPVELGAVALSVVERQGEGRPIRLPSGQGHAYSRVEATGEPDEVAGRHHALTSETGPASARRSTQESVVSHSRSAARSSPAPVRSSHARWARSSAVGFSSTSLRSR